MPMRPSEPDGQALRTARDRPPPPRLVLVYQMQKVASMSWMALGRSHLSATEAVHVHFVAKSNLAFLRKQFEATGAEQTIRHRLLLRKLLQTGAKVRALIEDAALRGRPTLLVTGMRDPVARSVSLLFFLADFYGRNDRVISWRDGARVEDVHRVFIEAWEQVFDDAEPADTFSRVLRFYIKAYGCWFEQEIGTTLGIDIMRAQFPAGPAHRVIPTGQVQSLLYRTEDMTPGSRGHDLLRADFEAVFGAPLAAFPIQNAAAFRNSRDLYQVFVHRLRVPARLLDQIYDHAVVRCFYLPEEIDGFRRRWSGSSSA
jgi:hypothetical protein